MGQDQWLPRLGPGGEGGKGHPVGWNMDGGAGGGCGAAWPEPSADSAIGPSTLRSRRVWATRQDSGATAASYHTSRMPLRNMTCITCMYLRDGFPVHERQVHAHEKDRRHEVHAHHPGHEQDQHVRVVAIVYCILSSPPAPALAARGQE